MKTPTLKEPKSIKLTFTVWISRLFVVTTPLVPTAFILYDLISFENKNLVVERFKKMHNGLLYILFFSGTESMQLSLL